MSGIHTPSPDFNPVTFHKVLEMVDTLLEEEQERLLDIVQHRLNERGRERIAQNVMKARAEFAKGEIREGTVEELVNYPRL